MSRNRQVFPREQVAHLWANASQDSARDPSGNMYFTGPALYSYGSHFCIAYRYGTADGGAFFVFNADSYSATTSKMQYIARHAVARFHDRAELSGLRSDSFCGIGWRGRMMREALTQSGREYDAAWNRTRDGAPRRAHVAAADSRARVAELIAAAVLADKSSNADDKKAARATVRTLAAVRAIGNETRDDWAARARLLVRDEQRANMARLAEQARAAFEHATNADHLAQNRARHARDGRAAVEKMRDIARAYGFRAPRVPDFAPVLAEVEPLAAAETLRQTVRAARLSLERAEQCNRDRAGSYYVERNAADVAHHAGMARSLGGMIPAAWGDRAAVLLRRAQRAQALDDAARTLDRVRGSVESGDSYAAAGHARDAGREYRNAARAFGIVRAALDGAGTHPAAVRAASMVADMDRAAAYVADLDARIAEENAAAIADWRNGGRVAFRAFELPPMLRLSSDGKTIETSHGASVPASIAPRLWRLIERARGGDAAAVSAAFRGLHVGPFTLAELRADGSAVIGCHDIPHAEMAALASRLAL